MRLLLITLLEYFSKSNGLLGPWVTQSTPCPSISAFVSLSHFSHLKAENAPSSCHLCEQQSPSGSQREHETASPCALGIDVASLRLSTLGGLLTNFLGGVGIRTYPVTAVRIHPQLWVSFMGFPEKAHGRKYGSFDSLLYAHILKILIGILLLFTHFACHGDELSLYISLCDYLFKVHLSLVLVSSEGFDHSSSLNS